MGHGVLRNERTLGRRDGTVVLDGLGGCQPGLIPDTPETSTELGVIVSIVGVTQHHKQNPLCVGAKASGTLAAPGSVFRGSLSSAWEILWCWVVALGYM